MTDDLRDHNRRTVAGYEICARDYAASVPHEPSPAAAALLRRFAGAVGDGGRVLDIGSGPGWDADFLETLGVRVHRTDVTAAFRAVQAERGKHVDVLDLLGDEIDATYDGVMLLYVLQHFERAQVDAILRKLANALRDGGTLLLSHAVGTDEIWQHGDSGDYRVVRWLPEALDERLLQAGLAVTWDACSDGQDERWRCLLATRRA